MFPEEHVTAMLAAGPVKTGSPGVSLVDLVRELSARPDLAYVHLEKDGFAVTVQMPDRSHA